MKVKRWSHLATLIFSILFIAVLCFTLLPTPFGAGVATASGENWLLSNGTAYGDAVGFVPFAYRRSIDITAGDPAIPANYKVPINIHRGSETVEYGTWTVNSKTYNNRVAFTVHTHEELAAAYPIKIVVDTASLVTGRFFGNSTSGYAKTPEWTSSSTVTDTMKYWCTEAGAATPSKFNTSGTIYYVELPSGLAADTDHTMYMYVDPLISAASSNYSGADTFSFFEHFDTTAGNLTAYLAAYTAWEQSPATLATQQVIFTASDPDWEVPLYAHTFKVLVIGGGGGAGQGSYSGGGGGAGGLVYDADWEVTPGESIAIVIGEGGAGSVNNANKGTNGNPSSLTGLSGVITAAGGGGGGSTGNQIGAAGSSGGGGSWDGDAGAGGAENQTPDQGHNGGTAASNAGGGGGGAGDVGVTATTNNGGVGGIGIDAITDYGFTGTFGDPAHNGWVAGGGSGGGQTASPEPSNGGGGASTAAHGWNINGDANTGGGGGGNWAYAGGNGGSGVVIIQYGIDAPVVSVASSVLTLSNTLGRSWSGIATKTSGAGNFTIQNFQTLMRVTSTVGTGAAAGMFSNAGLGTAPQSGILLMGGETVKVWADGGSTSSPYGAVYAAPFLELLTKYSTTYQMIENWTDDVNVVTWGLGNYAADDVSHKIVVASYGTNSITLDWIAVMPEIETPPYVKFPDILYEKAGAVFLDNKCLNWPYDIAFTDNDGNTTLNWWSDPLTELTRQPGDSMQATVKVTDDLAGNQTIYIYYGHDDITTTQADCSPTTTYDIFDDFSEVGDPTAWTEKTGSWTDTDVTEPTLSRGDVGNVGGGAGRLWARFNQVVKWGDGTFYMIFDNVLWEKAVAWPCPYRIYIAHSDTIEGKFEPGHLAFTDGSLEHHAWGYWPTSAQVINGICYVAYTSSNGVKIAYCSTSDDPTVPANWTINAYGPFFTASYMNAVAGTSTTTSSIASLVKDGSTWRIFVDTLSSGGNWDFSTNIAPENWTNATTFTIGHELVPYYMEDSQLVYDGSRYWYWAGVYIVGLDPTVFGIRYFKFDEDAGKAFPGNSTADWVGPTAFTITYPLHSRVYSSPRLIKEGASWYQFISTQGSVYWVPNWVTEYKCATLDGSWVPVHTDKKYKQATTTEVQKSYVTASSVQDGEIIAECQLGTAVTNTDVGIIFRYDATTDSGYYARLNSYDSGSGGAVFIYKFSGATYTNINTEGGYGYIIPTSPTPGFYQGYPWRLRVQFYGATIKVSYSPWGNEWVNLGTVTDATYLRAGLVGVSTNTAEGYFNNFRVRGFTLTEPVVGQAEAEEYPAQITNTPTEKNFGTIQPSTYYWGKSGTQTGPGSWPLGVADCIGTVSNVSDPSATFTINVLFSVSAMTGGITWNPGTTPGANVFVLKAGIAGVANEGNMTKLSPAYQELITNLAIGDHIHWEFVFYSPTNLITNNDQAVHTGYITQAAEIND